MYQWVRAYGHGSCVSYNIAIFYFVVLVIIGNIMLLSLFTAILLKNFDDVDSGKEEENKALQEQ